MATKTFYMNSGMSTNVHQSMSISSPGANSTTSPNYGWTVAATTAGKFASADAQTMVPAASFSTTAQPDGSIVTTVTAGDCWRTPVPLNGSFDAGTWTFQCSIIQGGTGLSAQGRCNFRLHHSPNADGSGATEVTSTSVVGSTVSVGVTQTDSIGTASLSAFTVTNEYLFIQIGWEVVVAAAAVMGVNTCAVILRFGGTASQVTTTNYTNIAGETEWHESANCTNVADVNKDWLGPNSAQVTDGEYAQFINTSGLVGELSDYLNADTFGYTTSDLLDSDTITGILLEADLVATVAGQIVHNSLFLVVNGSTTGTDQSDFSNVPTTQAIKSWGGAGNLLGAAGLNGAHFRSTNTGFRLQLSGNGISGGSIGKADQMRIKLFYTRLQQPGVAYSGGGSMSF